MDDDTRSLLIQDFRRGIIIVCVDCGKVDINPETHGLEGSKNVCDPEAQRIREENNDRFY